MTSKTIIFLCTMVTIIGISATALAGTRGISVQIRASEAVNAPVLENVDLYQQSYALVIGIDEYTNGWPRLSNAVKDARLVASALEKKNFTVDLHENLTSAELAQVFKRFFILKGEQPEARLFVWYAGHGATVDGEGYLVPADAPVIQAGSAFKFSSVALRDFGTFMRQSVSKHVYAVFDSCFAGTVFTAQRAMPPAAITRATTLPVRQFLTSGDADQTVSDDGQFRELFIRAITGTENSDANGDGYLTASEIGMYLGDRITNLTEAAQTPRFGKLRDRDFDRGDFVFILPETPGSRNQPSSEAEVVFWESIQSNASPDELLAYISAYPNGLFANLAKIRLSLLQTGISSADRLRPEIALTPDRRQYIVKAPTEVREAPNNQTKSVLRLKAGATVFGVGVASMPEPWLSIAREGVTLGYVAQSLLEPAPTQPTTKIFAGANSAPPAASKALGSEAPPAPSFNDLFSQTLDSLLETSGDNESVTEEPPANIAKPLDQPTPNDAELTLRSNAGSTVDQFPDLEAESPRKRAATLGASISPSEAQSSQTIETAGPPETNSIEQQDVEVSAQSKLIEMPTERELLNAPSAPSPEKRLNDSGGERALTATDSNKPKGDEKDPRITPEQSEQQGANHQTVNTSPLPGAQSDAEKKLNRPLEKGVSHADQPADLPSDGLINEQSVPETKLNEPSGQENWNLSNLDITQPKPISKTEDRNFTEFLRRYLLSAANGNQDAQLSLGYMYETGERVEQDPIEAERWYTKAAQQDNIQAILNLANLLITSSDPDRQLSAINWYEKAGELGNADAQEILGYQYQTGQIIETDLAVAAAWYLKAANQERPAAQNNLARLYQLGQGVEKDLDQAIHWYERAAALGSEAATNNLKKLLP